MRHRSLAVALAFVSAVIMLTVLAAGALPIRGEEPAPAGVDVQFTNCRTGVGVVGHSIMDYNVDPLNLGWYVDWQARLSGAENGMDYYFTIRVKQDTDNGEYLPTYQVGPALTQAAGGLGPVVAANPGSVWLIGNEPDIATQDGTEPEKYAEIYHEVYQFIKAIDPTAKAAIGSIVQPTPLRLEYLDRVLTAYRDLYGAKMPVDVWSTHLYVAREVRGEWGVKIPVGIEGVDYGRMYTLGDAVDVEKFVTLVYELRTWMKARGYQEVPLVVPEWGGLMPLWFLDDDGTDVTEQDFHEFVRDTIAFMSTEKDADLGFAGDDYRLVQQSAFWSLNADHTFPDGYPMFGPPLFESASPFSITSTGMYYRDVIASSYSPEVDLFPYRVWSTRGVAAVTPGETVSVTLHTAVSNSGNSVFAAASQVEFVNVTNGASEVLGTVALEPFTGCGSRREVSLLWPNLGAGVYDVSVRVDPENAVGELKEDNNEVTLTIVVGTDAVYLPLIVSNF